MLNMLSRGIALAASMSLVGAVSADEGRVAALLLLPKYRQECGACHIAYPRDMLPAPSWQRLMNDLPRHFGTDASLDPATVEQLSVWLAAKTGTTHRMHEQPPQDRITRSAWFVRKHAEVPPTAWKLPAVKGAFNCAACHAQADQGDFDEHHVGIPR